MVAIQRRSDPASQLLSASAAAMVAIVSITVTAVTFIAQHGETTIVAAGMLRTIRTVVNHTHRPADQAALRRHVMAVHEESRKHLSDRIGIEAVEQEFRGAMAALEDDSRSAAA